MRLANIRYDSGLANYFEVIDTKPNPYPAQQSEVQYDLGRKFAQNQSLYGIGGWVETQRYGLYEEPWECVSELD